MEKGGVVRQETMEKNPPLEILDPPLRFSAKNNMLYYVYKFASCLPCRVGVLQPAVAKSSPNPRSGLSESPDPSLEVLTVVAVVQVELDDVAVVVVAELLMS